MPKNVKMIFDERVGPFFLKNNSYLTRRIEIQIFGPEIQQLTVSFLLKLQVLRYPNPVANILNYPTLGVYLKHKSAYSLEPFLPVVTAPVQRFC